MDQPPSLLDLALQQCIRYAPLVVDIGGLPYQVVKPFLAKLGHEQLAAIERRSPHIMAESDELWRNIIIREFKDRKIPTSDFRQTFYRYRRDKEAQLGAARERLKMNQEQYNKNKRAASVVALSEEELPVTQRFSSSVTQGPFKSRTMQSVAKRAQANMQFRKIPLHNTPKYVKAELPLMNPGEYRRPEQASGSSYHQGPQQAAPKFAQIKNYTCTSSPLYSPPMSPPPSSSQHPNQQPIQTRPLVPPAAKRKRVSSLFIPKR